MWLPVCELDKSHILIYIPIEGKDLYFIYLFFGVGECKWDSQFTA